MPDSVEAAEHDLVPLQDVAAIGEILGLAAVQMVGFEHLQLEGHVQPTEVGQAICIATRRELQPQLICLPRRCELAATGPRHDACPHEVAHQRIHRLGGVRIVAYKVAGAVPEP